MKASEMVKQLEKQTEEQQDKIEELRAKLTQAVDYPELVQKFEASDKSKLIAIWHMDRLYENTHETGVKIKLQVIAENPELTKEADELAKKLKEKFKFVPSP